MNDHKPMHTSIYIHFVKHYTLVGGFNPSEKYVSQLGCYSIPNIWKVSQNSMVPNHQPVRVWQCWIYWMSSLRWHQMCLAGNPAMARQLGPLGPGGRWTPRNRWNSNTRTWARRKAYTTSLSLFFRSQMRAPWCWNMHTNIYPNNSSPSHVGLHIPAPWSIWAWQLATVKFPQKTRTAQRLVCLKVGQRLALEVFCHSASVWNGRRFKGNSAAHHRCSSV